ncbi:MAG: alpha/beta fold hydrolase [Planctomycetota bacterium]
MSKRHRERRPFLRQRWWKLYVLLVAASAVVQSMIWTEVSPDNFDKSRPPMQSPRFTAEGAEPDGHAWVQDKTYGGWRDDERPVLILLHGSPGSKENFDLLGPMLAERFRVVAIDLPGFGESSKWVPSYSTRAHARYVLEFMDRSEIDSAHVLGFSMGSGVALNMHDLAPGCLDSIIFYGGIGIQEGEGSGDYHFEHFKYIVGYGALVALPELVPHFGLPALLPGPVGEFMGTRAGRHAFIRNFHDTDQRPMRGYLEDVEAAGTPLLILHGRHDPLVPAWTAEQHHAIVKQSELVMFDRSHFMVFDDAGSRLLADEIVPFVEKHSGDNPDAPSRRTLYFPGAEEPPASVLPVDLNIPRGTNPWLAVGTIIGASYLLEDPTTITVGLLVRAGQLDPFLAVFAIFTGIFTGDLALYLIGRVFGRRALVWGPVSKRLPVHHVEALGQWFDTKGWSAVLASRFIPGTRLPLYVAAGALGKKPGRFALWTCLAVMIWAPVMLVLVVVLGEAAASPFRMLFGDSWLALIAAIIALLMVVRVLMHLPTKRGRQKLWVKVSRVWRWEFWPMWIFYVPLVPWLLWLSARHRSLTVWTLANPALPDGGVVGESKAQIMDALSSPSDTHILSAELVEDADAARRVVAERGWTWPLILKPDAAQRGAGVRRIEREGGVDEYFADSPGAAVLQEYHAGPFEAGVFYLRTPGEPHGRIFSITDKHFPELLGDGRHTFEELVWAHPRLRMQAAVFLRRFEGEAARVPAKGEKIRLAEAGNHCQGTEFRDGAHLITPGLEAAVDSVIQRVGDFYFGRLDVRYADAEAFKRGEDFAVIELNGVTSESTNLYDPSWSLIRAYRTLFAQWAHCFAIGDANRRQRDLTPPRVIPLLGRVRAYYKQRKIDALSD